MTVLLKTFVNLKLIKPSNMEIKVTSCADCPIRSLQNWCNVVGHDVYFNAFYNTVSKSCPLKQQSITVKLENDDILNELRKSEIY